MIELKVKVIIRIIIVIIKKIER